MPDFLARVALLTPEQGGRSEPIVFVIGYAHAPRYEVILNLNGATFLCAPQHPEPESVDYMELAPGKAASLMFPINLTVEKGDIFLLQEGRKVVAEGVVTQVF